MSNNRNSASDIISQLVSNSDNTASNTYHLNFNNYSNCYNTYNRSEESSEDDDIVSTEIQISSINTPQEINRTNNVTGRRTATRTAVVPIPLNSSQEDINSQIQNAVNTIINDTSLNDIAGELSIAGITTDLSIDRIINTSSATNTGLTLKQLNDNTEVTILNEENESDNKCSICNEKYNTPDICRTIINCKHTFHQGCIDTWLSDHSKCPICNQIIG